MGKAVMENHAVATLVVSVFFAVGSVAIIATCERVARWWRLRRAFRARPFPPVRD
jgi:hypothetical protein